ncbi:MAG: glucose-1-phosphate adenylyltransferase [Cyanobacteria bacterium HKST-UBA04]|nr:glucose-1-phosphate adenylyltransferase [Cyanobacteria bacterium HKST-UBA04]MCA9840936.1 glucose-1-phosphate adenylyltransferase [Cyanobacteria bacterium HKST-UBA03]
MNNVLGMIMAGGEGTRLYPLTRDRAKPAVPFGAKYRIIDFVLSNFVNSGITRINIMTQFKSDSLNKHVTRGWPMPTMYGDFIDLIPAQMRIDKHWYQGTADAIYQNIHLIDNEQPKYVAVFGADHIYTMDVSQMVVFHQRKQAECTIAAIPVPKEVAHEFGIIQIDEHYRVVGWQEKPQNPTEMPDRPGWCLASMGNYVYNTDVLVDLLNKDAPRQESAHDFGKNVVPGSIKSHKVYVYNFFDNEIPGSEEHQRGYWRDVGTLDAYWEATMDLVLPTPALNLYNKLWPVRSVSYQAAPTKYLWDHEGRKGHATNSLVADGCIISGGRLDRCVLSPHVRINSYSEITESILMHGVVVGRHAKIHKAIIDKDVIIPPHTEIGVDAEADRARGFTVSAGGVTVVAKGSVIEAPVMT